VTALSRSGSAVAGAIRSAQLDLREEPALRALLAEVRPQVVYHLAALSHVGRSWEDPAATVQANAGGAASLLEALRREAPDARVVWVSTSEVYGALGGAPIDESAPLTPSNPYAVSKAAGEMLATLYAETHGLDIVRVRPFNHAGPGQRPIFIVSSLAQQAAAARRAGAERVRIVTGNPDTRRDFTDVRDVVRAYRLLAEPGREVAGALYNLGRGCSVSAAEQVALLAELLAPISVEHVVDPARVRAHEVMDRRADPSRLCEDTGWSAEIPLRTTMSDTVAWWERELGRAEQR
jgi:GDP-4-dehydro-6-deoxy-D-mannose reductase